VIILLACWTPKVPVPLRLDDSLPIPVDKLAHVVLFAGFVVFWRWAGSPRKGTILTGLLLGIVTELGQNLEIVGRSATLPDLLADALGVLIGEGLWLLGARARELLIESAPPSWRASVRASDGLREFGATSLEAQGPGPRSPDEGNWPEA
jgi:hypothetical protein